MPELIACPSCGAHVFAAACACPHCAATLKRCGGKLATTAAAAAMGLALSGCGIFAPKDLYGGPDTEDVDSPFVDRDGDGFGVSEDCDDQDAAVHPDAEETPGDGVDSNCDGDDDT